MITLALIGAGSWGRNYIKTVSSIKGVKLKYIFARTAKTLNTLPGIYNKIQDYKQLPKYKDIDGVIIATPATTHFPILKYLMPLGYYFLVEKPLVASYQDAIALKNINEKNKNSMIMTGHIYLYNPAFIKMLDLISNVGDIKYIDLEGCNWGPFRSDVSALWDYLPHDVSMCLELLKKDPIEVSACGINSDMVYLRFKFEKNIKAFFKIGRMSPVKKRRMEIVGNKGSLIFDDTSDNKITFFKHASKDQFDKISRATYPSYEKIEPLRMQLNEFINCIKNNKNPKTDLSHALKVIKIIHFAEKSLKSNGKTIEIL